MNIRRALRAPLAGSLLLSAALAGGVTAAAPAAAASEPSCPSGANWSASPTYRDSAGQVAAIGHIYTYNWGGCAYLVAQGSYYGMYKWMDVQIQADNGQTSYDGNHYYYYAGPVSASSSTTGGLCMTVWFDMLNSAGTRVVQDKTGTPCN
ncbi:hypothetical protein [Streptomyces sp. NK08204]|uniref:hypothetical protein n=1 Tax=Streptomyces sp. NK08204 TaxID=2873260 RepID=UPI001CEDA303|nr:hypothetical protein [Streptomyces sp. NK08204]